MSSGVYRIAVPGRRQRWLDGAAVNASALRLIHCLLLPAVLIAAA